MEKRPIPFRNLGSLRQRLQNIVFLPLRLLRRLLSLFFCSFDNFSVTLSSFASSSFALLFYVEFFVLCPSVFRFCFFPSSSVLYFLFYFFYSSLWYSSYFHFSYILYIPHLNFVFNLSIFLVSFFRLPLFTILFHPAYHFSYFPIFLVIPPSVSLS